MESHRAVSTATVPVRAARAAPLVLLAVFFAWPVASMLAGHLRPGAVADVVTDASLRGVAWFTLWQAVLSTLLSLAVGLPLTWAVSRWTFRGARLLAALATVPFLMPAVVMATGVAALLPSRGIPAVLWAHTAFNVAVVLRVVGPTWAMLDRAQEESAASLGAAPLRVFADVTWPAISGAVRGAASLVFAFCFASFAVVSILGGPGVRTIETEVFTQAVRLGDTRTAVALTFVQAIVVLGVLAVGRGGGTDAVESLEFTGARHVSERMRGRRLPAVVAAVCCAVVTAPMVAVAWRSVRLDGRWTLVGFRALFDGSLDGVGVDIAAAVRNSLWFTALTVAITVPLALLACRRHRAGLAERLSLAPLLVSAVTLGLGIIITFDSSPFDWRGKWWMLPVIHAVIALPLAVRVIGPALRGIGTELLESSADLGAGPLRTWRSVQLPLLAPALARAAGISAAVSLGEFGATSFLTRGDTKTVPIVVGELMSRPGPLLQQSAFGLTTMIASAVTIASSLTSSQRTLTTPRQS
jgi:thiamine transport system permease protein